MILCDFLSRVAADGGDPMDLVPVAFNTFTILKERYSHTAEFKTMMAELKIMTRVQRAAAGIAAPPPVHGTNKGVDPSLKPEKQAAGSSSRSQAHIQTRGLDDVTSNSQTPILPHLDLTLLEIPETGHKMKVVQPLSSIRIWFKEPGFMTLLMSLHLLTGQTYQ